MTVYVLQPHGLDILKNNIFDIFAVLARRQVFRINNILQIVFFGAARLVMSIRRGVPSVRNAVFM